MRKLKVRFDERVEQHIPDDPELAEPPELELSSESGDDPDVESDVTSTAKNKKKATGMHMTNSIELRYNDYHWLKFVADVIERVPSEPQFEYVPVDAPVGRRRKLQIKCNMLTSKQDLYPSRM